MPLNQQPDRINKASSRTICNRRFDKQRRKRSSRGGGVAVSQVVSTLLIVLLIFLVGAVL